jgi:hypothetical protein
MRGNALCSSVFQSLYGPSREYNLQDMMIALNVVVYQLPISLTFHVRESCSVHAQAKEGRS